MSVKSLIIYWLITVSLAEGKKVFRNQQVLDNENDPNRDTIHGKYIVFFDIDCINQRMEDKNMDIIKEFLSLFRCYTLNKDTIDLYPNIVNHWIYMDKQPNCDDEDDFELEWDVFCIIGVHQDEIIHTDVTKNRCRSRTVESELWNLDSVSPSISNGIQYVQYDSSYDPNIDIIVMDSGIDTSHPQFGASTLEFDTLFDAFEGTPLHFHGTFIAGILFGQDYGAFRAHWTQIKLLDVRVFDQDQKASSGSILNGYNAIIEYLDANPGKKVIINMSFSSNYNLIEQQSVQQIREKGGIIIASAGNTNADLESSPLIPASSNDVITVGNHDQTMKRNSKTCTNDNGLTYDCSSNYGNSVDIWAPGTDIKSAILDGGTDILTGTSAAAPLVAGIAANILANNPSLDFNGIKSKLLEFAVYDVDDRLGNKNLPRVQASCGEYGYAIGTIRPQNDINRCTDAHTTNYDVYMHPCHFRENQQWIRGIPDSNGWYTFISPYNNQCLNVDRTEDNTANVDTGDNIKTWPCHGGDNQLWKIDGDLIKSKANGGNWCLDFGGEGIYYDGSNNIHIQSCDVNNGNQKVNFIQETNIISSRYNDKCLDVSTGGNDNVYLHSCHGGNNQIWRRGSIDSDGYYTLRSRWNNKCLDAHPENDGQVNHGDNIYVYPCHGQDNQLWKIENSMIYNKANGGTWCLDGGDNNLNVHIWNCWVNNENQKFIIPQFSAFK